MVLSTKKEMKMKTIDDIVITRRDFSKLAIAGAIGAALPGSVWAQQILNNQADRIQRTFGISMTR